MLVLSMNSKRQRRPSVRLGEVGDVPAASACWFSQATRDFLIQTSWENDLVPTPEHGGSGGFTGSDHVISPIASSDSMQKFENKNPNSSKSYLDSDFGVITWKTRKPRRRIVASAQALTDPRGYKQGPVDEGSQDGAEFSGRELSGGFELNADGGSYPHDRNAGIDRDGVGSGVRGWLEERGFGEYADVFEMHEVDEEALPLLTFTDLKEMGVFAIGHRRKLYTAIQQLRCGP